jgi:hypothetical protein
MTSMYSELRRRSAAQCDVGSPAFAHAEVEAFFRKRRSWLDGVDRVRRYEKAE